MYSQNQFINRSRRIEQLREQGLSQIEAQQRAQLQDFRQSPQYKRKVNEFMRQGLRRAQAQQRALHLFSQRRREAEIGHSSRVARNARNQRRMARLRQARQRRRSLISHLREQVPVQERHVDDYGDEIDIQPSEEDRLMSQQHQEHQPNQLLQPPPNILLQVPAFQIPILPRSHIFQPHEPDPNLPLRIQQFIMPQYTQLRGLRQPQIQRHRPIPGANINQPQQQNQQDNSLINEITVYRLRNEGPRPRQEENARHDIPRQEENEGQNERGDIPRQEENEGQNARGDMPMQEENEEQNERGLNIYSVRNERPPQPIPYVPLLINPPAANQFPANETPLIIKSSVRQYTPQRDQKGIKRPTALQLRAERSQSIRRRQIRYGNPRPPSPRPARPVDMAGNSRFTPDQISNALLAYSQSVQKRKQEQVKKARQRQIAVEEMKAQQAQKRAQKKALKKQVLEQKKEQRKSQSTKKKIQKVQKVQKKEKSGIRKSDLKSPVYRSSVTQKLKLQLGVYERQKRQNRFQRDEPINSKILVLDKPYVPLFDQHGVRLPQVIEPEAQVPKVEPAPQLPQQEKVQPSRIQKLIQGKQMKSYARSIQKQKAISKQREIKQKRLKREQSQFFQKITAIQQRNKQKPVMEIKVVPLERLPLPSPSLPSNIQASYPARSPPLNPVLVPLNPALVPLNPALVPNILNIFALPGSAVLEGHEPLPFRPVPPAVPRPPSFYNSLPPKKVEPSRYISDQQLLATGLNAARSRSLDVASSVSRSVVRAELAQGKKTIGELQQKKTGLLQKKLHVIDDEGESQWQQLRDPDPIKPIARKPQKVSSLSKPKDKRYLSQPRKLVKGENLQPLQKYYRMKQQEHPKDSPYISPEVAQQRQQQRVRLQKQMKDIDTQQRLQQNKNKQLQDKLRQMDQRQQNERRIQMSYAREAQNLSSIQAIHNTLRQVDASKKKKPEQRANSNSGRIFFGSQAVSKARRLMSQVRQDRKKQPSKKKPIHKPLADERKKNMIHAPIAQPAEVEALVARPAEVEAVRARPAEVEAVRARPAERRPDFRNAIIAQNVDLRIYNHQPPPGFDIRARRINQMRVIPWNQHEFAGQRTEHRRLLNLGNLFISINRRGRYMWVGQEIQNPQGRSYYTKNCIFFYPRDLQNIARAYQRLEPIPFQRPASVITLSLTGASLIKDLYKGAPYYGLRMMDVLEQAAFPTRNGFNLTPPQMIQLIQAL